MAFLGSFAQPIIEVRQDNVVLVQNMNPSSASALNTSIPRIRQTLVLGFAVEHHSSCANPAKNLRSGIVVRAVIDYLDLHLFRPGILLENAPQCFLQIIRSRIISRYHHGPVRTLLMDGQDGNWWRRDTGD